MAGKAGKFWVELESTAFPTDNITIETLDGRETISQLFEFDVRFVVTATEDVSEEALLGTHVSLAFSYDEKVVRRVHGTINQVDRRYDATMEFDTYRVKVVPLMWCMAAVTTQEIYLNMSVPEIIEQKLGVANLSDRGRDYEMRLHADYPKRDFVVQYNETDLAFVCRLAEHLGISFFFEHGAKSADGDWDPIAENGVDKVVFADSKHHFSSIGDEPIQFRQTGEDADVYELSRSQRFVPKYYWLRDYDYQRPDLPLNGKAELEISYGAMGAQIEYGGHFFSEAEATALAQVRSQEGLARQAVYQGKSDILRLTAGRTCRLDPEGLAEEGLLMVELRHHVEQTVLVHGGTGEELSYRNEFCAIAADRTFRPPRLTPVPRIAGVMTGFVRGVTDHGKGNTRPDPPLAAIDDQGRYVVALHFDTPGRDASNQGGQSSSARFVLASAPIRMLQPSAGNNYGIHLPLRAGTEVQVAFVGGDPDRPVIVGAVNNGILPNVVGANDAAMGRIKSQSGVIIEFSDA